MSNEVAEPLIHTNAAQDSDALAVEDTITAPGWFIWILTFTAGLSGLLFGYDTGVISSTLVSIGSDLSNRTLTTLDKSLITACTSLFALLISPVTGFLADALGRKNVLLAADGLFIVGALWQAFTSSVWGMIGGRSIVGLAIGAASFIAPLYIAELSPSALRGRLVTISVLMITGGQVVAYVVGWLLSTHASGWRWMVGIGALPAATQCVILRFMPETPRWLVKAGRQEAARGTLIRVYGKASDAQTIIRGILKRVEQELHEEEEAVLGMLTNSRPSKSGLLGYFSLIKQKFSNIIQNAGNRRALIIACMLQGSQQLCGFNSLMYFSATIFALVGFSFPTLTSLAIAITNFVFTLVAFYSIDRVGRRRILLLSIPIMVLGLALCAISFSFLDLRGGGSVPSLNSLTMRAADNLKDQSKTWALVILVAMVIYVGGYAIGLGNVPWQQSELFPLSVRSVGSGLSTTVNWMANFVIGLTFLPMMDGLTPSGTFGLYAVICFTSWIAVYFIYPETAGMSLEDVGVMLKEGWGVKESDVRWMAIKSGRQTAGR